MVRNHLAIGNSNVDHGRIVVNRSTGLATVWIHAHKISARIFFVHLSLFPSLFLRTGKTWSVEIFFDTNAFMERGVNTLFDQYCFSHCFKKCTKYRLGNSRITGRGFFNYGWGSDIQKIQKWKIAYSSQLSAHSLFRVIKTIRLNFSVTAFCCLLSAVCYLLVHPKTIHHYPSLANVKLREPIRPTTLSQILDL